MKRLLILLMLVSQPAWAEWLVSGKRQAGRVYRRISPSTSIRQPYAD